jgi:hypothetical protein
VTASFYLTLGEILMPSYLGCASYLVFLSCLLSLASLAYAKQATPSLSCLLSLAKQEIEAQLRSKTEGEI